MTRRSSWAPLESGDPTPGDSMQIRALAARYGDTRAEIETQAANLGRLSQADGWDSDAGRGFSNKAGELHGDIDKVKGRYGGAAEALYEWARQLDDIQAEADAAAADAERAQATAAANQPVDGPDDAPEPTDAEKASIRARADRLSGAEGELSAARTRMDDAKSRYGEQARRCADAIADACDDGLNDSTWDKVKGAVGDVVDGVKGWIKEHADLLKKISDILGVVAAIVGVVGFILSFTPLAPLGALLQGVAAGLTLLKLVIDTGLALAGEGSWMDVGMGLFALATFGVGRAVGAASTRAATSATAAARSANATRAVTAANNVKSSQTTMFGLVNKFSVAQRVAGFRPGNPIARMLASPVTSRASQYVDDVTTMADDAAAASQGLIPGFVDGAYKMQGYPGVLSSLKYGGAMPARDAVTVQGLVTEFPEVASLPRHLSTVNQMAGAGWSTTLAAEGTSTVTGGHADTVEKIGNVSEWTWNKVTS